MDEVRLQRLLDVGRSLVGVLDPEIVLQRLLEVARELTGARYAAIGVLDASREGLERFLTAGISDAVGRAIGDPPRGRGVLGVLIKDPRPLRLADVAAHAESYGFPSSHPPMRSFLGVPIVIEGRAWGNLYLTEKAGGAEFSASDEEAAVVLADWAAIAINNARLYRDVREQRDELERTIRGLEATTEISRALGGETDLARVLELVVKRSRALLDARAAEIVLADGEVGAVAGEAVSGEPALTVPVTFRNRPLGSLRVYGGPFGEEDDRLLRAFAASAATAMATAQHAGEQALRQSLEASEAERSRWGRELHDETLQQLAGLRMLLAGARRSGDRSRIDRALETALEQLTTGIGDLRSLIADLRPAALDELGLAPALETLVGRSSSSDVEVDLDVSLDGRPPAEIESTVYRVVQEALTNVLKHAAASRVAVVVRDAGASIEVVVRDDGAGFDPHRRSTGFGLVGMRERLALVRGTLDIQTAPGGGTTLRAVIPHG
ncbi:GAF domain-containing sensor histidine kinase [Solirubrobacter ginsenosidimutans]|uniref:GAF domain-containing sensor histidine kinase n=1 Tax=Solirubrobacter ginsenosidimutans TaxID=490573 RepID=A0A9X3MTC4_9ACTN|nr:GAF domain-containing sensor histidine kinase [Solirubrobacter ginsenosidimutans]MDA0162274.1 GAF domain-containing sensor histidine kinase [Solirubrobacter ginsenosidimutans]